MPAVRGYRKVTITAVQIGAGAIGASIAGVPAAVLVRAVGIRQVAAETLVGICVLTGVADLLYRRFGTPRPLALHRQVPRYWGHRNGPWKASIRYGLRMGVGPATILTTWTWWAALVVCALGGVGISMIGAVVYATCRFVVSSMSTVGIADGTSMARRSRALDSVRSTAEHAAIATPFVAVFGLVAQGLIS